MSKRHQKYICTEDIYLQPIFSCIHCRAHLASQRDLISKSFQGSQGRAYLFSSVVNVGSLVAEERLLLTGLHYVADIYCYCCSCILGWKYEKAFEPNQRYKEGKYIVEVANLIKDNGWDLEGQFSRLRHRITPMMYAINWDMSSDSLLSKTSQSRRSETRLQSKSSTASFIREFSRDLQHIFGRACSRQSHQLSSDIQEHLPTPVDPVTLLDELSVGVASNSTVSTSIDLRGAVNSSARTAAGTMMTLAAEESPAYQRMNSDDTNATTDPLANSLTLCLSSSSTNSGGGCGGSSLSQLSLHKPPSASLNDSANSSESHKTVPLLPATEKKAASPFDSLPLPSNVSLSRSSCTTELPGTSRPASISTGVNGASSTNTTVSPRRQQQRLPLQSSARKYSVTSKAKRSNSSSSNHHHHHHHRYRGKHSTNVVIPHPDD